jgi:membrane-bound serine protease (ClpP class)
MSLRFSCAMVRKLRPKSKRLHFVTSFAIFLPICFGEMQEWLNWHAWRACVPPKGTVGSNPTLSARTRFRILHNAIEAPTILSKPRGRFDSTRAFSNERNGEELPMTDLRSATLLLLCAMLVPPTASSQNVHVIKIDGSINPASADFLHRSIQNATEAQAECLIIELNTPGGLLKSTRVIVSDILEAKIPVVVYVAPAGAQSASAGVFITLAANIAAMAPGTNIGAAHPVSMQGSMDSTMTEKATNDAAAFVRTIAEKRQRNIKWAEEAVRNSISITETEALRSQVIDIIARNLDSLLVQLDAKTVELPGGPRILHTKGAAIERSEMGFAEKVLDILSDPNFAYILMLLGIYGLLFELYNPGAVLPGVVGGISLILAFYSLHTLPVNYAGLALILFGILLFIVDIKAVSHGILSLGGVVSLVLGSMMLIRSDSALEFVQISWSVILTSAALSLIFFMFVIGFGLRALKSKPPTGREGLIGETGESLTALRPEGRVRIHGEIWNAVSESGTIAKDVRIRVVRVENLTLHVEEFKS